MKKVTIELDEDDAKFLVQSARRFVNSATPFADAKSKVVIDTWKRIADATIEPRKTGS